MKGIATKRIVLAVLGIALLLVNPAGVCAGTMSSFSPSHPCCPKPSGDLAKSSCLCIENQPSSPVLPAPGELAQSVFLVPAPSIFAELPVEAVESRAFEDPNPAPHAILLSIHQLLL